MAPQIPDRWRDYKPIGKKIEGTRFIAFKVPLREHISCNVDRDNRLDGSILLEMIPNLGLVIDLTNTYRFYDPIIFEKEGVKYIKIMIPGHETPRRCLVNKFISTVKDFMETNRDNNKLVGVHCTHGVNRTGYLICNYMISQMNIEPNDAMNRFANSRGHKIERKNYIEALLELPKTKSLDGRNTRDLDVVPNNWRKSREPDVEPNNWRKSREPDVEPNNWKKKREPDVEPNNWRQKRDHTSNYHCNSSRERYTSRRSASDRYLPHGNSDQSRQNKRNDSSPYRRPSDRIEQKPKYIVSPRIPNEEQLRIAKPSHLRCDYYNTKTDDVNHRCTYIRKAYDS